MSYDYDDVRPARGRRYDDDDYDYDYDYEYDRKPRVKGRGRNNYNDLYPKQIISYAVLAVLVILTVIATTIGTKELVWKGNSVKINFIFVLLVVVIMLIMGFFLSTLPAFVTAAVVALILLVSLFLGVVHPILYCSGVLLGTSLILRDSRL